MQVKTAMRMSRIILRSVACRPYCIFLHFSRKPYDFRKKENLFRGREDKRGMECVNSGIVFWGMECVNSDIVFWGIVGYSILREGTGIIAT